MILLGIETSCDETSVAVIDYHEGKISLKSNVMASSLSLHAKTGGIIPEIAARKQIEYMQPVLTQVLTESFGKGKLSESLRRIDAIAVTYGPGLIGSLLVGVETAKTLAYVLNKPIIQINHMVGHIYANWIEHPQITFPAIALVISGGHTDMLLMKQHGEMQLLGGTRDDAAGEAFDKIGRLLGYEYPAGPIIEELAKKGDPKRFRFPRPLIGSPDYDFSFSGLKTAVLRETQTIKTLDEQTIADLARGTQDAIIDVIIKKTLKAAREHNVSSIVLSGGVAANQTLHDAFTQALIKNNLQAELFAPSRSLCTDNAAMIAAAAAYNATPVPWKTLTANPQLYFE